MLWKKNRNAVVKLMEIDLFIVLIAWNLSKPKLEEKNTVEDCTIALGNKCF